jgi:transposase-like protein
VQHRWQEPLAIGGPHRRGTQETGRWLNNKIKNSHLPFRRRERAIPADDVNATSSAETSTASDA